MMVSSRKLAKVRHLPSLKKNMISLGTLHVNGFNYKGYDGDEGSDYSRESISLDRKERRVIKPPVRFGYEDMVNYALVVGTDDPSNFQDLIRRKKDGYLGACLSLKGQEGCWMQVGFQEETRTKHIYVRFHKIRELATSCEILLEKVHTSENPTNMLTKPITVDKFKHCLDLINVF
ncbi:hypothetical protein V2J09_010921 [Rumex salicifolius]